MNNELQQYLTNKYIVTQGRQPKTVSGDYFTDANGYHKDDRRLLGLMSACGLTDVTFEYGEDVNGQWKVVKKINVKQVVDITN